MKKREIVLRLVLITFWATSLLVTFLVLSDGRMNCIFSSCHLEQSRPPPQNKTLNTCLSQQGLRRDLCIWSRHIECRFTGTCVSSEDYELCLLLEDPHLQYLCGRTYYRPHLKEFLLLPDSELQMTVESAFEDCTNLSPYETFMCTSLQASYVIRNDNKTAIDICTSFGNERLESECMFMLAIGNLEVLNENITRGIDFFNTFCKTIDHPSWRAECYYVLADELSFRLIGSNEDIAQACVESYKSVDYSCIDHVGRILMSADRTRELCTLLKGKQKHECYFTFGLLWGYLNPGTWETTIAESESVPAGYEEDYLSGLSVAFCENIGLCGDTTPRERGNLSLWIQVCEAYPSEFQSACFEGLGFKINGDLGESLDIWKGICQEFPRNLSVLCLNHLDYFTDVAATGSAPKGCTTACQEFVARANRPRENPDPG